MDFSQLVFFMTITHVNFILVVGSSLAILVAMMLIIAFIKTFIIICPPNRVFVISGRKKSLEGGASQGFRIVFGGRDIRIPIFEQVEEMDLSTIPIAISVNNAYSKGGIALHVKAVANVKVTSDEVLIRNAIERFMGRDQEEIRKAAKDTLEGNLREVLATLTPEQINEDRLKFAESLVLVAEDDLQKLGLHLDILKIQHVADNDKYLDSIGRQRTATIIRDAKIAESNAQREAENIEAEMRAKAQVVKETTTAEIARAKNELRQLTAELDAKAKTEEEKTKAAALEARAIAEQELQTIRANLENLRLQADKVIPAESMKLARQMQAKAIAAPIAENGKAQAQALDMIAEAWAEAGDEGKDIFLIQQLEKILSIVVSTVDNIQVGDVHLLDSGDGQAIPNYVRSYPATIEAILESLSKTTGIDISKILAESIVLTTVKEEQ